MLALSNNAPFWVAFIAPLLVKIPVEVSDRMVALLEFGAITALLATVKFCLELKKTLPLAKVFDTTAAAPESILIELASINQLPTLPKVAETLIEAVCKMLTRPEELVSITPPLPPKIPPTDFKAPAIVV